MGGTRCFPISYRSDERCFAAQVVLYMLKTSLHTLKYIGFMIEERTQHSNILHILALELIVYVKIDL